MDEKQVLASFISRLPHAIAICDEKGTIRLCNSRAEEYLLGNNNQAAGNQKAQGKNLSSLMDSNLLEYGLDEINEQLKRNTATPTAAFVFYAHGKTLQAAMLPVFEIAGGLNGFIMILEDITRQGLSEKRAESMLKTLSKNARSPLASIRAAVEAMQEFPDMDSEKQETFKDIIHKEAVALSDILNDVSRQYSDFTSSRRSLQVVSFKNLLASVSRRSEKRCGVSLHLTGNNDVEEVTVRADPFFFTDALLFLLERLHSQTGAIDFFASYGCEKELVALDIWWRGNPLKFAKIKQWEARSLGRQNPVCLGEVLEWHNSALWAHGESDVPEERQSSLRLIVPIAQSDEPASYEPVSAIPESRMQFHDMELFDHSGSAPELDNRLLTELAYTALIREINQAARVEEIMGKQSQLPRIIHSMLTGGSKIRTVTWLISAFADAILEKLLTFAVEQMGPPPVPFAFICLGSEGRKEQTLKTDQDNAIIFQDPANEVDVKRLQSYFLKLGETVCTWLDQAGFDFCRGGIMAMNPQWCQPLSVWKSYFSSWIRAATPEDLLHTSIFFDFRFIYGQKNLVDDLATHLFNNLANWPGFFHNMAENAVYFSPPIALFGRLIVKKKGPMKNCLDIKMSNTPLVDFARIYALRSGIAETGTQDRLYQLYVKRILSRREYNELDQAYTFNMQLRFMGQIEAILGNNQRPNNMINPSRLSTIEKRTLKEVLKKIKSIQEKMRLELAGPEEQL